MKLAEIQTAIEDGSARTCPICKGDPDYEGPEFYHQPVEGMAGMDVPSACRGCTVIYRFGSKTFGQVTEERFIELAREHGLCESCGTNEGCERCINEWGKCTECLVDECDDVAFHSARDEGVA